MDKDNTLVQVTPDDIAFVEQELGKSRKPAPLRELAEKLAFRKTASQRTEAVKRYDPNCVYQIGDSIYKEYDETLTIGVKVHEHFQGAVVLKVVSKIPYPAYQCEMIEVDYTGGGTFRKYIDFMKKTKTQVLLPSNQGLANAAPPVMDSGEDPRLTELPMQDRELKALEKNLKSVLAKVPAFFSWGDRWQIQAHQPAVSEETVKDIEALIAETKASADTADLVRRFFALEPSSDLFDIHCLWLNHLLETKHKKEFLQVSPVDWGKWHLKAVLNAMPEGLPLAADEAALPEFDATEKVDITPFHEFPLKVYLSWREILSGGVKIPKSYNKELTHSREYVFTDADENKSYLVYHFPQLGCMLGLKEFFAAANIPQGTSMTLEKCGPVQFNFWIKKSKKKIGVAKTTYDTAADVFADAGEAATLALPNKIIYLERDHLAKIIALYPEREGKNLRELLILVFRSFGVHTAASALHYLRAYHLVDVLKRTTQENVELTLLNTPEFEKSDKKKGVFFYREAPPPKAEIEAPGEAVGPGGVMTPEEMALAESAAEHHEAIDEVAVADALDIDISPEEEARRAALAALNIQEKPRAAAPLGRTAPAAPKKEKEKKKLKIETDRRPKTRKSERRVLEESIADQESEKEALLAVKDAEEDILEELGAKVEMPEEAEAAAPGEEGGEKAEEEGGGKALFGSNMFAEKLKSALVRKRKEEAEHPDEEAEPKDEPETDK